MQLSEVLLQMTKAFQKIPRPTQAKILERGLERIHPKAPNFIIFDSRASEERIEDNGETVILPGIAKEKVYVKLDDYGTKEALSESCGYPVNTRYTVTFLLAEEY